jgi:small subunit ribosomal protein S19e
MVTVYDVTPNKLVGKVADKLKGMNIPQPAFIGTVKSGSHRERMPSQKDFWYIRLAAILRNTYIHGNVGVGKLRTHFGGKKIRGVRPERKAKSGGSIIRKGMQALEKAGLLAKKKTGRELTAAGKKLLDAAAKEAS